VREKGSVVDRRRVVVAAVVRAAEAHVPVERVTGVVEAAVTAVTADKLRRGVVAEGGLKPATARTVSMSALHREDAAAAKKKARPEHPRPSACQDGDCKRAGCVAYREGREDGYERGFPDGVAACPLGHV
jgi:hypothetical protein